MPDLYSQLLGIDSSDGLPDHYRLLGLALFDDDVQRIAAAAQRQLLRLIAALDDEESTGIEHLMLDIKRARECLTDPESRSRYNTELRNRMSPAGRAGRAAPIEPPPIVKPPRSASSERTRSEPRFAEPPPASDEEIAADVLESSPNIEIASEVGSLSSATPSRADESARRAGSRGDRAPWIAIGALAVVLLGSALGYLVYAERRGTSPSQKAETPVSATSSNGSGLQVARRDRADAKDGDEIRANKRSPLPDRDQPSRRIVERGPDQSERDISREDADSKQATEVSSTAEVEDPSTEGSASAPRDTAPTAADDSPLAAEIREHVDLVRQALAGRELEQARRLVRQLEERPIADTETQALALVDGGGMLVHYVDGFWQAVHSSVDQLNSGDEIKLGNKRFIVVERTKSTILIRSMGQTRQIDLRNWPKRVGPDAAEAFARRWFKPDEPSTDVFVGTFLAVDKRADRDRAREVLLRAVNYGAPDAELVMMLTGLND